MRLFRGRGIDWVMIGEDVTGIA